MKDKLNNKKNNNLNKFSNYLNNSYEETPFYDDFIFSTPTNYNNFNDYNKIDKKNNNEIEFDCNGLNLSDSSFTIFDMPNTKEQISDDLEKKIDQLIIKNIQKDYYNLKIEADYKINKNLIFMCFVSVIFSILILLKPFNLNLGVYFIILFFLPVFILNIFSEFKENYLKYSNDLSKMILNFLGIYVFASILIFLIIITLRFSEFEFVKAYINPFIYFIPVFSLILIAFFFTLFLKEGFRKYQKLTLFNFIQLNIFVIFCITIVLYLKISTLVLFLKWMHIMIFVSFFHGLNFIGYCYFSNNKNVQFDDFSERKNDDSILAVFDILINLCLICFYFLLGLYLDDKLVKVKINSLFLLTWIFYFCIIVKNFYKIKKIQNYFDWRNVVIN